jgi:hypothetical protein
VVDSCDCGNECSSCIKDGKYLNQLSHDLILGKDHGVRSGKAE